MKNILIILAILFASLSSAQDIITVMHYNILGYTSTNYISCDSDNNNIDDKDNYIATIFDYVKPDIFTVNEISNKVEDHERLLSNSININEISSYKKATSTNYASSSILNQLYYNSDKFTIVMQDVVLNDLRDINVYKLRYCTNDVYDNPIYLYCIVAHLKAGSYDDDEAERATMASKIMSYLDNLNSYNNILVMGDFNVYTSTEEAYQNMINHSNPDTKMNDPIDEEGYWNTNSSYSHVHTQSTHTVNNSCASYGGLDDRFDFILASNSIMHNTNMFAYVTDSYKAVGQDGEHYNDALNDYPSNTSVPSDVLSALYNNSDHLPVTLKLKVNTTSGIDNLMSKSGLNIQYQNPCSNDLQLHISNSKNYSGDITFELYSILGQKLLSKNLELNASQNHYSIDINKFHAGTYFMHFVNNDNNQTTRKLIIK